VGGAVFDAVLPLPSLGSRVPVYRVIAHCNDRRAPATAASASTPSAATCRHGSTRAS